MAMFMDLELQGNVTLQLCNLNENDIKQIYDK